MNTHSHFLITAFAGNRLKNKGLPVHTKGFLLGSVLPDAPLFLFTFGYFAYRYWIDPVGPGEHIFGPRYDNLYFSNPFWIVGHSLFHAPFLIGLMAVAGYLGARRQKKWGNFLFWFALACGLHTTIDILTHHDDGPALFFPFNWYYRIEAPVSYWDPHHYGSIFASLSLLLDVAIIVYFGVVWWLSRRSKDRPA